MVKLGVNLDHVATIRQQRYTPYPDMLTAIKISEDSGADSITMHLREDRRHIQFEDINIARKNIKTKLVIRLALLAKQLNCDLTLKHLQLVLFMNTCL